MIEAGVNDAVRHGRSAAEACEVFQVSPVHLGAGGEQRPRPLLRAGETQHLVAGAQQLGDDGGADETGRAGDENTHVVILLGFMPGWVR